MSFPQWRSKDKRPLKNTTISLPMVFLELIEEFKKADLIPSRSEYIRMAVMEKLSRDAELMRIVMDEQYEAPQFDGVVMEYEHHFIISDQVWKKK